MKKYFLVATFIIIFGGIANTLLWIITSYFVQLGLFKREVSIGILFFSVMYSIVPVLVSMFLIGQVEKAYGNKFIWWIHSIPFVVFLSLLIYWKSYFGMISLSVYYLIGIILYYRLVYKTLVVSAE